MASEDRELPSADSLNELAGKPAVHRFLLLSLKLAEEAALKGEKSCDISFYKPAKEPACMYSNLFTLEKDETTSQSWFGFMSRPSLVKWANPEDETYYMGKLNELGYTYESRVTDDGYGGNYPHVTLGWSRL